MSNPRVFLDISIENVEIGRIMIELFSSVVPKTAQNFLSLCVGTNGKHYKNSDFHRIIKDFMIQGGDFTNNDGTGGCSIYENTYFEDENFQLKHDQAMLLSMANRGPGTNGSQFFITSQATPHLDGKHVVFGRVVKGQDIFRTMENVRCDENDKPLKRVWISHCGELERVLKAPVIVSEQQESEKSEMDEESEEDSNPYVIGVAPPPEADVPNRFLNDAVRKPIDYKMPSRSKNATDSRGRKIKGRGNLKYEMDDTREVGKRDSSKDRYRQRSTSPLRKKYRTTGVERDPRPITYRANNHSRERTLKSNYENSDIKERSIEQVSPKDAKYRRSRSPKRNTRA